MIVRSPRFLLKFLALLSLPSPLLYCELIHTGKQHPQVRRRTPGLEFTNTLATPSWEGLLDRAGYAKRGQRGSRSQGKQL